MPGGDRKGPMGMGPRTGRGVGYCSGYGAPGFQNPAPSRGGGMGFGRGGAMVRGRGFRGFGAGCGWRGWRNMLPGRMGGAWPQNADPESEKQALQGQADYLESELETVKKRLHDLESGGDED